MPRRTPSSTSAVAMLARWPFGIALTAWHYMWRTTPLHRRELPGSGAADGPPPLPDGLERTGVQLVADGDGALFHRRYRGRVTDAELSATELMDRLLCDPDRLAPSEFARFAKVAGDGDRMGVNHEYVVRMPGPWNGPVRAVEVTATSFRLVTLEGHLEAGQIEFRAEDGPDGLTVTIESWARSGDRLARLLHERLRMAKEVQLHMWTSFIENAARYAGGRLTGGIDIETHRVDEEGLAAAGAPDLAYARS